MCSVVGYIGNNMSRTHVLQGLERLEYRGYDSAGFACLQPQSQKIQYHKTVGTLDVLISQLLQNPIDGHLGIGHTRWATHGITSAENTHPHFDCNKTISIVHNGIIENYHTHRQALLASGHAFYSETDTEVLAHICETSLLLHQNIKTALVHIVSQLQGTYAFIALFQSLPDVLIAVRKGSPLCIGIGDEEMFIASDVIAFAGKVSKVLFLADETFAIIRKNGLELYDFQGNIANIKTENISVAWKENSKNGFEHFMLKEIYEQKDAISQTLYSCNNAPVLKNMGVTAGRVREFSSVHFIGCGTSWHAGLIGQFFFEEIVKIPTKTSISSEFRYRTFFPEENCLYMAISQSGETADTLEGIGLINAYKLSTVALTNVASSSMVRQAQGFLLTSAGQEVAVASTKAFSTQLAALFWLAHKMAFERELISADQMEQAHQDLLIAANILENSIEKYRLEIENKLAHFYAKYKKFIFLGRGITYPLALEAALKLKEISYIFAQAYPIGELKHGPIALIDSETSLVLFSHANSLLYQKLLSNAQEIKAREGHLIVFAFEGQQELIELADTAFVFPHIHPLLGPLAMTGLMQFFAYQIAKILGCSIDKPRNLAKSVTVE